MATIKFDYTGQCGGGGHSYLDIMVNGAKRKTLTVNTEEMISPPAITIEEAEDFATTLLKFHRRKWLKDNPTGTNEQYITALEAEEWVI